MILWTRKINLIGLPLLPSWESKKMTDNKERKVAQYITLNNGQRMPTIGLGTWRMNTREEVANALITAVDKYGYACIDTAQQYRNEALIGDVLANELKHIKRDQLFIISKVWNTNHAPEHVRQSCEQTLKNLRTHYLDLYLVHWPVAFEYTNLECEPIFHVDEHGYPRFDTKTSLQSTWQAMEGLVDAGLTKSIGVSNYSLMLLYDLMTYARIKPVVNQVEVHPYFSRPNFIHVCHKVLNIQIVAYRPLAYGPRGKLLEDGTVCQLAQKHGKTAGQIILRWALQHGLVVLPKASSEKHIKENIQVYNFELSEQDMVELNSLNRNLRMCNPDWKIFIFE
jgi:diketogulonate reductase-like aldo/keto reductase